MHVIVFSYIETVFSHYIVKAMVFSMSIRCVCVCACLCERARVGVIILNIVPMYTELGCICLYLLCSR